MKRMTGAEIRQSFLDFFASKDHLIVPSASLVPVGDPTLLLTNAGMNQFKSIFLGLEEPRARRVTDAQKCMRVSGHLNDLEEVGISPYHHTFFEMMGNWSFGDYYKREAIAWAWELVTGVWGMDKARLWATVFEDDQGDLPTDEEAHDPLAERDRHCPRPCAALWAQGQLLVDGADRSVRPVQRDPLRPRA